MYLIVGLGNPGSKYDKTRHNVGFSTIDVLAKKYSIDLTETKHKGLYGKGVINGNKVILVKPQTFMNLSGECVRELVDYFKIDEKCECIVIYDDISLAPGKLRIRTKGSAGGHNGIKNIILHFGHEEFLRVKVGVGEKPKGYDLADYVLGHFDSNDMKIMQESFERAADAAVCLMGEEPSVVMNKFN